VKITAAMEEVLDTQSPQKRSQGETFTFHLHVVLDFCDKVGRSIADGLRRATGATGIASERGDHYLCSAGFLEKSGWLAVVEWTQCIFALCSKSCQLAAEAHSPDHRDNQPWSSGHFARVEGRGANRIEVP